MDIKIISKFEWGSLWDGNIQWPMSCRLEMNQHAQLIHVELVQQNSPLDLPKLLNQSFNIDLPEGVLIVDDAGFFYLCCDDSQVKPLNQMFPDLPIPSNIGSIAQKVNRSVCLWMTIKIQSLDSVKNILRFNESTLDLSAVLLRNKTPQEALNQAELSVYLDNIEFLPELKQNEHPIFQLKQVDFHIWLGKQSSFQLHAAFCFNLFNHSFEIQGMVQRNDRLLQGKLEVFVCANEPVILEEMPGLKFIEFSFSIEKNLAISGPEPKTAGFLWLSATVKITYGKANFEGNIILSDCSLLLAQMQLDRDLALSEIIANSLPSVTFPSDMFDLTIQGGSNLYYRSEKDIPADKWPQDLQQFAKCTKGFCLQGGLVLFIRKSLVFEGRILITPSGFNGEISLPNTTLDLFVLQFSNLSLVLSKPETAPQKLGLSCDIALLNEPCGNTFISLKHQNKELFIEGRFTACDTLKRLINFRGQNFYLSFCYSKSRGFHLLDFPKFDLQIKGLDIIEKLRNTLNKIGPSLCGTVSDFICKSYMSTLFKITPKIHASDKEGFAVLDFNASIHFLYFHSEAVTFDFPNVISLNLPQNLSLSNLGDIFQNAIIDAADSFVDFICDKENEEKLGELIGLLTANQVVKFATTLVCRGIVSSIVGKAAMAGGLSVGAVIATGGEGFKGETLLEIFVGAFVATLDGKHPNSSSEVQEIKPPTNLMAIWEKTQINVTWTKLKQTFQYHVFLFDPNKKLMQFLVVDNCESCTFTLTIEPQEGFIVNVFSVKDNLYGAKKAECNVQIKPEPKPEPEPQPQPQPEPVPQAPKVEIIDSKLCLYVEQISNKGQTILPNQFSTAQTQQQNIAYRILSEDQAIITHGTSINTEIIITMSTSWGIGNFAAQLAFTQERQNQTEFGAWSDSTIFNLDCENLALRAKAEKLNAGDCVALLSKASPQSSPVEIASCMAHADYEYQQTLIGMRSCWPQASAVVLMNALIAAYNATLTPEQIAQECFNNGKSGIECAQKIKENFSYIGATRLVKCMHQVGYSQDDINQALQFIYPYISTNNLKNILS